MASRKEQKERLRRERQEAERREAEAQGRRRVLTYGATGTIAAVVLTGVVIVIVSGGGGGGSSGGSHIDTATGSTNDVAPDERTGTAPPPVGDATLKSAAAKAGCDLRLDLPDEGSGHLQPGAPPPHYGTNPPTSGNHSPTPQADGAYSEPPALVNVLHSLEHGRVEIQYSPDLSQADQLALKGVFDQSPGGVLLFPNPKMPYQVAETAWTNLMGCKRYESSKTLDAVRDFRDQFRGHGPEPVPINTGG
jgi:hypothetical protein